MRRAALRAAAASALKAPHACSVRGCL